MGSGHGRRPQPCPSTATPTARPPQASLMGHRGTATRRLPSFMLVTGLALPRPDLECPLERSAPSPQITALHSTHTPPQAELLLSQNLSPSLEILSVAYKVCGFRDLDSLQVDSTLQWGLPTWSVS